MNGYSLAEISEATGGTLFCDNPNKIIDRYVYDTRLIISPSEGSPLFLALRTPRRDGHSFISAAIDAGVQAFMVDAKESIALRDFNPELSFILVEDVLAALQRLARYHRRRLSRPLFIALTGSNGKTTVKEWLAALIDDDFKTARSPLSFNSGLGTALSILDVSDECEVALLEAGISTVGEMDAQTAMIQPKWGVFTNLGDAHGDGFSSRSEKLIEKLKLFQHVETIFYSPVGILGYENELLSGLPKNIEIIRCDSPQITDLLNARTFSTKADVENARLALAVALKLGVSPQTLAQKISRLFPVQMRTEWLTDNPEITVINDAYSSDITSTYNAYALLLRSGPHGAKKVILSDLDNAQNRPDEQLILIKEAARLFGATNLTLIGKVSVELSNNHPEFSAFTDVDSFIQQFDYETFRFSTVLLKGARRFALERLIPLFTHKSAASYLQIDLNALIHNFHAIKKRLPDKVQTMAMLKAAAYGGGAFQIARELVREGVDYLAVAYTDEGVELRRAGLRTPIMVLTPSEESISALRNYQLEPAVGSFRLLNALISQNTESFFAIHIEIDTGMGRLGFIENEIERLITTLKATKENFEIRSIFTHLAASESPSEDDFTRAQLQKFISISNQLKANFPHALLHALNSGGALRFPEYALDMIRLGIGLYGVSPTAQDEGLIEVFSLRSVVAQIHEYPAGTTVGYNRRFRAARATRVATIPVGYADGVPYALGAAEFSVLVAGKTAPIIGSVCMDMLMLDVTDAPEAKEGEEVVFFGKQGDAFLSVKTLAACANTIPYQILTAISPRVRRLYVKNG